VSKVLNGHGGWPPRRRHCVEELLREHHYMRRTPRPTALALIDLVFNELDSPWAVEAIRTGEAVTSGVGVVVSVAAPDGPRRPGSGCKASRQP
jgi:LacI family transcriptional regulator